MKEQPAFPMVVKKGNSIVKIYRHRNGEYDEFKLAYYLSGKRKFETFAKLDKAKARAIEINHSVKDGDLEGLALTKEECILYRRATDALKPVSTPIDQAAQEYAQARLELKGTPLIEAIRYYVQRHPVSFKKKTVAEVFSEMLQAKQKDGLSPEYIRDLQMRLGHFSESFHVNVSDLTAEAINEFLRDELAEVSGRSRNNYRSVIGTFLSFAEAQGYLPKDHIELEKLARAKEAGFVIDIYTPEQIQKLLNAAQMNPSDLEPGYNRRYAERQGLVTLLCLGAFAGLRTKEIQRQLWSDINIERGFIRVSEVKGNTAQRRLVPISPNLSQWLSLCRREDGVCCDYPRPWEALERVAERAGVKLKHNALRHSFISYRVAEIQNVPQVALEAGNSVPMIHRHYREVVTPQAAKDWFSVVPGVARGEVPMAVAA